MSYQIKQSSTSYPLVFLMIQSADHISGATGLSPTVTLSKAGGSFAGPSGSVTEIANGWYRVAGNATDSNTLGPLILHASGTGADPVDMLFEVVAHDVQDAVRLGLSALPNAAANANGGLPILSSSGSTLAYTVSTLTTYTGNTPQTGDSFARIGSTGSGLTSLAPASTALSTAQWTNGRAAALDNLDAAVSTRSTYAGGDTGGTTTLLARLTSTRAGLLDNLDAAITTRLATAGYTAPPSAATVAAAAWDLTTSGHTTAGTFGAAMNAAGSAGDPWATSLPGSYGSGTAGKIVGDNLNATVSSRLASASISLSAGAVTVGTNGDKTGYSLTQSFPTNFASLAITGGGLVSVNLAQTLSAARALDAVADTSLTLNDAAHAAIAGAAGKESCSGTAYLVKTPSTGTVIRSFQLDSATSPTSRT
jgi:hypothetical protein